MRDKNIQSKLLELNQRAAAIKADPRLRHAPNEHGITVASENAKLMQTYRYQTIKAEGDKA